MTEKECMDIPEHNLLKKKCISIIGIHTTGKDVISLRWESVVISAIRPYPSKNKNCEIVCVFRISI